MKKIIAFALSVVLMLSTQLSVFAYSEQTISKTQITSEQPVSVEFVEGEEEKTYHVTVLWLDNLDYTYTSKGKEWDSQNLQYKENEEAGTWTGVKNITIYNRSNTEVQVWAEYDSDYDISMGMNKEAVGDNVTFESEANLAIIDLPSAAFDGVDESTLPFAKFSCTLSGNLDTVIKNNKDTLKPEDGKMQLGTMSITLMN